MMKPPTYMCNICGQPSHVPIDRLEREKPSCDGCGSTPRLRGVVHALSLGLFRESLPIPRFPARRDLRGLGLSDWEGYATRLVTKFDYTNTFLTQSALISEIDESLNATFDFVISSEVFEHVEPPVERAFRNARRLLRSGGVLVLTVPYGLGDATVEHFNGPSSYEVVTDYAGRRVLEARSADGTVTRYDDLVFHGGDGATLEMRVFALVDIKKHLRDAGFRGIEVLDDEPRFGVAWPEPWSRPILAIA